MSLGRLADRYALEIGSAPFGLFGVIVFGLTDWRFWLMLVCMVWLIYWVKRQVAAQIERARQ